MQNLKRGEILSAIPNISLPVQFQMPLLSESRMTLIALISRISVSNDNAVGL